ncbi:hypothetical protein GLAREA_05572 [Glarea lozoyensis ATCC 20868]|uniref:Uncharacterized protein n=1 Tax=Glarea lozoyensis (strain ATCC 20868 / MF5171) TaxID=1116229 RepID=S3DGH5_GLAL2|nr:uncharacterized protein GLAREA_05572 [Glarea lozoyensis ATCC 20868]EPE36234.1 hypothetical protein GLAREA_05572 [Glarea lozoyensis ATCC 20868]
MRLASEDAATTVEELCQCIPGTWCQGDTSGVKHHVVREAARNVTGLCLDMKRRTKH